MGGSAINVLYINVHMSGGVDIDLRFGLHYGNGNMPETAFPTTNIAAGIDAWHYAKDHSARDASWDNKMATAWGSAFTNLGNDYKDNLWSYMHLKNPPQ
jgi:hypothetical protein